jgi:large subunit ribosomal protein L32e
MTDPNSATPDKALRLRARVKKKKPKFVRPESWRYVRLKENWRNPRGLDSKVRLSIKGWPPSAGAGFGGPRVTRGLHPSGYEEVLVHNVEQLREIAPKSQAARIGHTVGKRKRARILAEARKRRIVVLNLREAKQAAEEKLGEEKEEETAEAVKEEAKEAEKASKEEKKQPKEKVKKGKGRTREQ